MNDIIVEYMKNYQSYYNSIWIFFSITVIFFSIISYMKDNELIFLPEGENIFNKIIVIILIFNLLNHIILFLYAFSNDIDYKYFRNYGRRKNVMSSSLKNIYVTIPFIIVILVIYCQPLYSLYKDFKKLVKQA